MERRRALSKKIVGVEKSPLIDSRTLRSCRSTPASSTSRSLSRSASVDDGHRGCGNNKPATSLTSISEAARSNGRRGGCLNRSQSAPHGYLPPPQHYTTAPAQYRLNPMVRFDERPFPERMNYGIAGYNTSRRRPRSFSSGAGERNTPRPRSFSGSIPESRSYNSAITVADSRPDSATPRVRGFATIPESPRPAKKGDVVGRSWTSRFRDKVGKMGRVGVGDTCSKLLSRFRG